MPVDGGKRQAFRTQPITQSISHRHHTLIASPAGGQLRNGALFDNLPGLHQCNPVTNQFDFSKDVRVDKDRLALIRKLSTDVSDFHSSERIQAIRGLIEKDEVGIVNESLSEREPFIHSFREFRNAHVAPLPKVEALEPP